MMLNIIISSPDLEITENLDRLLHLEVNCKTVALTSIESTIETLHHSQFDWILIDYKYLTEERKKIEKILSLQQGNIAVIFFDEYDELAFINVIKETLLVHHRKGKLMDYNFSEN